MVDVGGAVVSSLGLLLCCYVFYLVTDYRLLPAIRVVCEKLHVPDDVAGATLLGASLNAPELFTSVVSTFFTKNSVGVGIVLGSCNFNIFMITGVTALVARQKLRSRQLKVEWLFLQRDVYFYALSIGIVLLVSRDNILEWWECVAMVASYALYVTCCLFTGKLTKLLCPRHGYKPRRRRDVLVHVDERGDFDITYHPNNLDLRRTFSKEDLAAPDTVSLLRESKYRLSDMALESIRVQDTQPHELMMSGAQQLSAASMRSHRSAPTPDSSGKWAMHKVLGGALSADPVAPPPPCSPSDVTPLLQASPYSRLTRAFSSPMASVEQIDFGKHLTRRERMEAIHMATHPEAPDRISVDLRLVQCAHDEMSRNEPWATDVLEIAEEIELEEEAEAYHSQHLLSWPKYGSAWDKTRYVLNFPFHLAITLTIPSGERWYLVSILVSVCWLAGTSYLLSFFSTRWGDALAIRDAVVGLTVDSIGTSLPNLLAAVAAGKAGRSETAICQAFGSNTFDALVAFGLVQAIKSASQGFAPIQLETAGLERDLVLNLCLLFLYTWFLYFFRFRLTRAFGCTCIFLYAVWLAYELYLVYTK